MTIIRYNRAVRTLYVTESQQEEDEASWEKRPPRPVHVVIRTRLFWEPTEYSGGLLATATGRATKAGRKLQELAENPHMLPSIRLVVMGR
jgi:hypothetical protein